MIDLRGYINIFTYNCDFKNEKNILYQNDRQIVYETTKGNKIQQITAIDPYKTLDPLVFKQKDMLLKYIEKFEQNKKKTNIYTPKNLGIILYGPPGTGKN